MYSLIRHDIKKYIEHEMTFEEKRKFLNECLKNVLEMYKVCRKAAEKEDKNDVEPPGYVVNNVELVTEDMRDLALTILHEANSEWFVKI